jgi:HD-GYP domain-containing protein (c-di-GMP phosphodiesterase class II)
MAPTLALEQLKAHSGTQFDSNVVNAMIDVVRLRA